MDVCGEARSPVGARVVCVRKSESGSEVGPAEGNGGTRRGEKGETRRGPSKRRVHERRR